MQDIASVQGEAEQRGTGYGVRCVDPVHPNHRGANRNHQVKIKASSMFIDGERDPFGMDRHAKKLSD